jgi:hypothetical protein
VEKLAQARLVKIAHWRLAAWLNPFRMLFSQVVVNLLLKLGHAVDRVARPPLFERSRARGGHDKLDKRPGEFVHVLFFRGQSSFSALFASRFSDSVTRNHRLVT